MCSLIFFKSGWLEAHQYVQEGWMRFPGVSHNKSIDDKTAGANVPHNASCSTQTMANDCGDRCSSFVALASLEEVCTSFSLEIFKEARRLSSSLSF